MAFDAVALHPLNSAGSAPACLIWRSNSDDGGARRQSFSAARCRASFQDRTDRVAAIVPALYPHLPVVVFAGAPVFLHVHNQFLVRHRSSSFRSKRRGRPASSRCLAPCVTPASSIDDRGGLPAAAARSEHRQSRPQAGPRLPPQLAKRRPMRRE